MSKYDKRWRSMLAAFKAMVGCSECGEENPRKLSFHHYLSGRKKEFSLAHAGSRSLASVMREIEECDVLCKSCHKKLHHAT